jgi:hypothetical protein
MEDVNIMLLRNADKPPPYATIGIGTFYHLNMERER